MQPPSRILALLSILFSAALPAFLIASMTGCKSVSIEDVATPARIEAVSALGAYYGGIALVKDGQRETLERVVAGLKSIQASGQADLLAVSLALQDAGIKELQSEDGMIVFAAVVTFSDFWAGTVQPILDDDRARAVIAGTLRGFTIALKRQEQVAAGSRAPAGLTQETVSTRGAPAVGTITKTKR